jgi:hypothetical protein
MQNEAVSIDKCPIASDIGNRFLAVLANYIYFYIILNHYILFNYKATSCWVRHIFNVIMDTFN